MAARKDVLEAWRSIPGAVHGLTAGRSKEELDNRLDGASLSIRETVHHIVEANTVAASIVIAALGSPGCVYDWSWMMPFGEWMERLDYRRKPIAPALRLLEALNAYVAAQVEPLADGLRRRVRLRDEPGAKLRSVTVAEVLLQEVEHVREHIGPPSRRRSSGRAAVRRSSSTTRHRRAGRQGVAAARSSSRAPPRSSRA